MTPDVIGVIVAIAVAVGGLFGGIARMSSVQFARLEARLDHRFAHVDKQFEQVDRRFEQVDRQFERVDRQFEKVEQRFQKVESELADLKSDLFDVRVTVARIDGSRPGFLQSR